MFESLVALLATVLSVANNTFAPLRRPYHPGDAARRLAAERGGVEDFGVEDFGVRL